MRGIEFRIPWPPVAAPRPRTFQRDGRTKTVTARRGSPSAIWRANVTEWLGIYLSRAVPMAGPLKAMVVAVFPPLARSKDEGLELHWCRPDGDNVSKLVIDVVSTWVAKDDGQIAHWTTVKLRGPAGSSGWVYLRLEETTIACVINDLDGVTWDGLERGIHGNFGTEEWTDE